MHKDRLRENSKAEPGATKPIPEIFLMKDETPQWFLCGQCIQNLRKLKRDDFVLAMKTIRKAQKLLSKTSLSPGEKLFLLRWKNTKLKAMPVQDAG